MALAAGTRIGPYEVTGLLGEGGMGEVYRARDTKLEREVAIKVLPEAFAQNADRLARFEREARTLAALNHPNIAHIHGLEESPGLKALVMELVEGPTLADRLAQGAIPVDEALPIARQIAGALEAAHEQGIIHRDLKPANIKVRPDGTVKVLDFGLAKAIEQASAPGRHASGHAMASSPTLTSPAMMTQAGVILGTAAYMSPEQACGKPVDKRADIWAFGCVVYEMLTARRAFPGATITETLAAILERDVDLTKLPAAAPESVRTVLRRTLEKDSSRRLHDIADARIELDDHGPAPTMVPGPGSRGTTARWLSALVATSAVVGVAAWHFKPAPPPVATASAVARLMVETEAPVPKETEGVLALSPDGRLLAYVGSSGGHRALYLRELDHFGNQPVPGSENADCPAFSPDGRWLAFAADHQVKKVAVAGGTPVPLCEFGVGRGLSWESNDSILFSKGTGGIWRVPAAGGTPSAVTTLVGGEFEHDFPEILPGGKALLFSSLAAGAIGSRQIVVQSLETGERHTIGKGNGGQYLPTGHLVFADEEGNVFAQPFDVTRLEPKDSPTVVLQDVRQTQYGWPQMAFSAAGSMTYVPATSGERQDTLVWVDAAGVEQPTGLAGLDLSMPHLAPDLQHVAVIVQSDLWLYDLARDTRSRLTFDGSASFPLWEPTGTKLAYRSARSGKAEIDVKLVDGTAPESRLSADNHMNVPLSWSPDGRFLAAVSVSPTTANDIWTEDLATGTVSPFVTTGFREGAPTFSGDGHWIAYASEQSGRSEIYLRPFPGPSQEVTLSTDGGTEPVWARKAGRLFYRQGDAMMAIDITTTPALVIGKPRRLFEGPYNRSNAFWPDYDVTPNGRRLLMIRRGTRSDATRIYMVLNWLEELRARVPAN